MFTQGARTALALVIVLPLVGLARTPAAAAQGKAKASPVAPPRRAELPPLPSPLFIEGARGGGLRPTAAMQLGTVRALTDRLSSSIVRIEVTKAGSKTSQGSGFFIHPSGWLVTNNHVISGGLTFKVRLLDGQERRARVIGRDTVTDLALMFVEARGEERFAPLRLGDSDRVQVGDFAVAMGAPLRFDNTVTLGVVSSRGRPGSRPVKPNALKAYIQFDTPINPGSSGGALFDIDGLVVGVVTAMRKDGQGLGFAIPVNRLKRMLPRLYDAESVFQTYVGLGTQELDAPLAQSLGVRSLEGALVHTVSPRSPAELAGVEEGDVVVRAAGVAISGANELDWLVATAGDTSPLELDVIRRGEAHHFELRATRHKSWAAASKARVPGGVRWGFGVLPVDDDLARAFELPVSSGLLVHHVTETSEAAAAGLEPKMIVISVGDEPVASVAALQQAIEEMVARSSVVRLLVIGEAKTRRWIAWEVPP